MYFVFSKILLFLILPIDWIVVLLACAIFFKKPKLKKRCLITSFVLLIVFSNHAILALFASLYDMPKGPVDGKKTYSADIVLGGFTGEAKNGEGFFNEYSDRFIQGLKLKTSGRVSHILVSGGNGNLNPSAFTEAGWVKGELKAFNVPDSAILVEQQSRNTIENAAFSKKILDKAHLMPPYLLVTSPFHMRRAMYIFKKEGLDVIAYPCSITGNDANISFIDVFSFDAATLNMWNYYIKEVIGLVVTHIKYAL
jgi:uncharacterized SAM-binding protein YcdF (DUF218 family)